MELNQRINWVPEHIKNGRFGNWLENNVDWALGRERYWGTPLPIWECQDCRHQLAVGSVAELSAHAGKDLSELDLHRPYVDEVHFPCPECGKGEMQRVPELIDVWFDSGSMPVAQWHYPFEKKEMFEQQFPGRLHLRSCRPDPRLVLLAARHQHAALRPGMLQERDLPWA